MKKFLALGLILMIMAPGAGCQLFDSTPSSPTGDTSLSETTVDLDSPTGGFTEEDELPAFGEEDRFAVYTGEQEFNDPLRMNQKIIDQERHRYARVYRLRGIWGLLEQAFNDSTAADCCGVDWTGGMHLDGGYIIIERLIAFDAEDCVTRIDRSTIEWVSKTCPHIDGIQVKLIVPPAFPDSTGNPDSLKKDVTPPMLHIHAGPFERSFTMDELEALRFHQPVDRCGNGIMLHAHRLTQFCPHGFLFGAWNKVEPDTLYNPDTGEMRGVLLGTFRGMWISEMGQAAGFLRGVAGLNSLGEPVIFGKYVNMYGRFMGIIRGTYGFADDEVSGVYPAHGWFEGRWFGRRQIPMGRLKGDWIADETGNGFFKGLWGMDCSERL